MSSVDSTYSNAVSGMKAAKALMDVATSNITNSENENYSRRIANLETIINNGEVGGITVSSITRSVNTNLVNLLQTEAAIKSYLGTISDYNEQISISLGQPSYMGNEQSNIASSIQALFSSLKTLAITPAGISQKSNVVSQAVLLADNISSTALSLNQTRYQADQAIFNTVNNINNLLTSIYSNNAQISLAYNGGMDTASFLENRDNFINQLSQELDVNVYYQPSGAAILSTAYGIQLVGQNSLYQLSYTPVTSLNDLVENGIIAPILVTLENESGESTTPPITLVSSGYSETAGVASTISTALNYGNLKALIDLRDNNIPLIIDEIDNLAATITENINALHNKAAGFPSLQTMTGTRLVQGTDLHNWTGNVLIGLVDQNGNSLVKNDGTYLNPLNLNLGNVETGTIAGQSTVNSLINEINNYFYNSQIENHLTLGNLYDIKMVAAANLTTEPNGQFTFDFELDNQSQYNSSFRVLAVNITDPGCAGLISALPAAATINAGNRDRTGQTATVNFAGGSGGPYTIQVEMEVVDGLGNSSVSTVEFVINDNPGTVNIENNRYVAGSVFSGNAVIEPSYNVQGYATAALVDENGNLVTNNNPGYLQIQTLGNNYYLAIDDLTSQEIGTVIGGNNNNATDRGFSHYFELNNFFVRNPITIPYSTNSATQGSAINMQVRPDIIASPGLFSSGQLSQVPANEQLLTQGITNATATLTFAANPAINDTITIDSQLFTFVAAASNNTQITLGGNLAATLSNITSVLSATNSYTAGSVDTASYYNNSINTLTITSNIAGSTGNNFTIAANLATTTATLDSGIATHTPEGNLTGGTDITSLVTINAWNYYLNAGDQDITNDMAYLNNSLFQFDQAGNLTALNVSFSSYADEIIGSFVNLALENKDDFDKVTNVYQAYESKLQESTGVDVDEELALMLTYSQYYNACARVISLARECERTFFEIFK